MDERDDIPKEFVTLRNVVFPQERQNIKWAMGYHFAVGWTEADEQLALRLDVSNPGWSADRAVREAMVGLAGEFLARHREEKRAR